MNRIVLDASAGVDLVLRTEAGEAVARHIADAELHTAAHFDAEVSSALARLHRAGSIGADDVAARLDLVSSLDLSRAPITARMLREAWALREDVTARDALYVTLARGLGAGLVTTDRRLARAVPDVARGPADHQPG